MSQSAGPLRKRAEMRGEMPTALLYREWRLNRAWYGLALSVMVFWWAAPWMGSVFSAALYSLLPGLLDRYPFLALDLPQVNSVVMGLLAMVVFQNDWTRGHLARAFEGPVRRADILRAKMAMLLTVMVAYALLTFVSMVGFAAVVGRMDQLGRIAAWTLLEICLEASVAFLVLAASTAIGHPILVGVTAALWAVFPKILASVMAVATPFVRLPSGVQVMLPNPWATAVDRLSPFPNIEPTHHLALYGLYFLVWAVFMGYSAFKWWEAVPTERFGSTFFYPTLWNVYFGLLALGSSFVVSIILSHPLMPQMGWGLALAVGILSVPAWFWWRWVYRRWIRPADLPGAHPKAGASHGERTP